MPETPPPLRPTWDVFADSVLPIIGLPPLRNELARICPSLAPDRIDHWVAEFNNESLDLDSRVAEGDDGWTDEEIDGLWYDRMKSIALECLSEIEGLPNS